MRNQGRLRLGYFPLPLSEARRIRACLHYPTSPASTIDPCIGDGAAFLAITAEACPRRYGIELDAYRAEQAASVVDELIHGVCLDVHCPVESFGLVFLNPPYDRTIGEGRNERMERVFLAQAYRWLKVGGVLVLVVPAQRVCECGEILAARFKETRIFRLTDPEAVRYRQVVVLATRRSRRELEQLRDDEIIARRAQFANVGRNYERLPGLGDATTPLYTVPESGPPKLEYRGLPLDEIEDLLPRSSAYRRAGRILFPSPAAFKGRPLTPLHSGHVALCAVSGMLNGVFGSGKDLHVAAWQAVKVVDRSEEIEDDGTLVQRERERFTNELTLVFASGETAILR